MSNEDKSYSSPINWYPGHMAKAKREISEKLKLVDVVIELRDARIPYSSKNPMVDEIVGSKPRLIILNKAGISDKEVTKKWIEYLKNSNTIALDIDCINNYNINKIIPSLKLVLKDKIKKDLEKGKSNTLIRALIIGIPNVGKSTFINTLSKRKAAQVGDRPGVTKSQTWIKITPELQILDTPGILWPKFDSQDVAIKLSVCGSIKDEILNMDLIAFEGLKYVYNLYPLMLSRRYSIDNIDDYSVDEVLDIIAKKRGCLLKGGVVDSTRVNTIIINDIRSARIGAMSFERPND